MLLRINSEDYGGNQLTLKGSGSSGAYLIMYHESLPEATEIERLPDDISISGTTWLTF
jgi:hypothetical protein